MGGIRKKGMSKWGINQLIHFTINRSPHVYQACLACCRLLGRFAVNVCLRESGMDHRWSLFPPVGQRRILDFDYVRCPCRAYSSPVRNCALPSPKLQSSSLLMTMEIIKSCGDIPQFASRPSATSL